MASLVREFINCDACMECCSSLQWRLTRLTKIIIISWFNNNIPFGHLCYEMREREKKDETRSNLLQTNLDILNEIKGGEIISKMTYKLRWK